MAQFIQPQNREADLQAILEGYEDKISHVEWLAEAFQKDGIQNSWDARIGNLSNWSCTLFYKKFSDDLSVVGIVDVGTAGLTGTIPTNVDDVVVALTSNDPNERLSYFSSSNWSKKAEDALGSRGRGKMVFIGASRDRIIYFDSLRSDDGAYIFGKTYLDQNKSVSIEIFQGEEADTKRREIFGAYISRLDEVGTRVLIPNPRKEIIDAFDQETIEQYIQHTWWEILSKYEVNIQIEKNGWKKKVVPSPWMPVTKLGVKETDSYENIPLPQNSELKIKRISFAYLGEKEIPDSYKGLSVQRHGMVIQNIPISNLIGDSVGDTIFGSVELDRKLESVIRKDEGPEHYNIIWTRDIPRQLRLILREKAMAFARRYKLIEEEKRNTNRQQREAEVAVQRELNDLAKSLGFTHGEGLEDRKRKKHTREPDEPIRLSVPDFETPYSTGRVDVGQSIKGAYAIPINEINETLKVLIRVYIVHKDVVVRKEGLDLKIEKEIILPIKDSLNIGWQEMLIDKNFSPGQYFFRAKMISMEDKEINSNLRFEKGEEIYRTITRTFYVEEDPENKGMFKLQRVDSQDKAKYFWWEYEDKTWVIYWNGNHPLFKDIIDDENLLQEELRKLSYLIAFSIMCSEEKIKADQKKKLRIFDPNDFEDASFEELVQSVFRKQSQILWGK